MSYNNIKNSIAVFGFIIFVKADISTENVRVELYYTIWVATSIVRVMAPLVTYTNFAMSTVLSIT